MKNKRTHLVISGGLSTAILEIDARHTGHDSNCTEQFSQNPLKKKIIFIKLFFSEILVMTIN